MQDKDYWEKKGKVVLIETERNRTDFYYLSLGNNRYLYFKSNSERGLTYTYSWIEDVTREVAALTNSETYDNFTYFSTDLYPDALGVYLARKKIESKVISLLMA